MLKIEVIPQNQVFVSMKVCVKALTPSYHHVRGASAVPLDLDFGRIYVPYTNQRQFTKTAGLLPGPSAARYCGGGNKNGAFPC